MPPVVARGSRHQERLRRRHLLCQVLVVGRAVVVRARLTSGKSGSRLTGGRGRFSSMRTYCITYVTTRTFEWVFAPFGGGEEVHRLRLLPAREVPEVPRSRAAVPGEARAEHVVLAKQLGSLVRLGQDIFLRDVGLHGLHVAQERGSEFRRDAHEAQWRERRGPVKLSVHGLIIAWKLLHRLCSSTSDRRLNQLGGRTRSSHAQHHGHHRTPTTWMKSVRYGARSRPDAD